MYSRKCGYCGANLDPGEHCDCIGQRMMDERTKEVCLEKKERNFA